MIIAYINTSRRTSITIISVTNWFMNCWVNDIEMSSFLDNWFSWSRRRGESTTDKHHPNGQWGLDTSHSASQTPARIAWRHNSSDKTSHHNCFHPLRSYAGTKTYAQALVTTSDGRGPVDTTPQQRLPVMHRFKQPTLTVASIEAEQGNICLTT
jgi:hypothetical protein